MSKLAIKAENISKQYRLGEVGTGTLSHDLNRFWHKVRGKEDPYLQIGQANDRSQKADSNYVWSLKDINFEIEQGDAVGIIGRNGAGKSTLLKLLSKVTKPTTGKFHVNGRIASLLEVGTGFNPEMTGRENIYMNGAILGMRRHEITRKFDEIVDFSGVEAYIDTPVKRYSSGMYVRLAFAVAAHLESEILIVDEVLAVGDAEFQKKCLGKMGDVSKGEGRTVLFVSHNMAAVETLCNKGLMLESGNLTFSGNVTNTINFYKNSNINFLNKKNFNQEKREGLNNLIWIETWLENKKNETIKTFEVGEEIKICSIFKSTNNFTNHNLSIAIAIYNSSNILLTDLWNKSVNYNFPNEIKKDNYYKVEIIINRINFIPDNYTYNLFIQNNYITQDFIQDAGNFEIIAGDFFGNKKLKFGSSIVLLEQNWNIIEI
jgi:lipopolysaccharide transport system ATP-binding protein